MDVDQRTRDPRISIRNIDDTKWNRSRDGEVWNEKVSTEGAVMY